MSFKKSPAGHFLKSKLSKEDFKIFCRMRKEKDSYRHINQLNLPHYLIQILKDQDITTLDTLMERTPAQLLALPGLGRKGLNTIVEELSYFKLQLHSPEEDHA